MGFKNAGMCTSIMTSTSPAKWGESGSSTFDFLPKVGQKNPPTAYVTKTTEVSVSVW
jgi:hypothetical protein